MPKQAPSTTPASTPTPIPEPGCLQSYSGGLRRGEIVDCVRGDVRHWKHQNADDSLRWWGAKLDADELAEAARIRALGGIDHAKIQAWLKSLDDIVDLFDKPAGPEDTEDGE